MTGPGPNNHKQGWHGPRPKGFKTLNRWSSGMWKKYYEPVQPREFVQRLALAPISCEPVLKQLTRKGPLDDPHNTRIKPPDPLLRIEVPVDMTRRSADLYAGSEVGELLDKLASFHDDFVGFVRWAFPWGEKGTMLEGMTGPEQWQLEQQERISKAIREGGAEGCVVEEDVASGHGIGKSAEVSWAILWAISTSADTRGVVTANTDTQLRTKTWAELGKWYQLFIARQLFTLTATAIFIAGDPDRQKTWRIDQIPWSKERSEAFAGLHNQGKRIIVIFDEASAIDDLIWDVTEGALTDAKTQILWLRYGNPTKTSGRFFKNCLAEDTPVLTDRGWVPIQHVTPQDKVWDGVEWVSQKGAQMSGHSFTLSAFNVRMTPDHRVLTTKGWVNGQACQGLERAEVRLPDGFALRGAAQTGRALGRQVRMWQGDQFAQRRHHQKLAAQEASVLRLQTQRDDRPPQHKACDVVSPRLPSVGCNASALLSPVSRCVEKLWWAGHQSVRALENFFRQFLGGHGPNLAAGAYVGTGRQFSGVLTEQLRVGHVHAATQQHQKQHGYRNPGRADDGCQRGEALQDQLRHAAVSGEAAVANASGVEPVYDLIDCGPRHRFVVAGTDSLPLIVHNCTQGKRNTYVRVDSRTVSFTNKKQIEAWIEEYGEDSDFVRVRVKGEFPRAGYANFISPELVGQARRRRLQLPMYQAHPKILAVDPARFGDDFSVITLRQGLKVHFQVALSGFDGVDLASRIFEIVRKEGPISCIAYDAIGNGADLDSALRRMQGLPALIPVTWGVPAKDEKQYFNQRSECWGKMREFLENGQIPDDDDLGDQLISLDYGYDARFRIQLQSKKDLKRNGGKSPDKADSLALTFVPDLIDRKVTIARVKPVPRRTVIWSR